MHAAVKIAADNSCRIAVCATNRSAAASSPAPSAISMAAACSPVAAAISAIAPGVDWGSFAARRSSSPRPVIA